MFPVSVVVLTFFVSVLLYLFAFGSQLSAHNIARKESGESEVNENDPSIYAMENKTAWRIDGGKWKEVCSLASCLIVIRDIVCDNLETFVKHHPNKKSCMQSVNILKKWMTEWASNLTLTYKIPQIKKLLEVALLCLEDGKARSVEWSKAPGELQDYLKEHYTPFYNFHFPAGSDDETDSDREGVLQSKTSRKRKVLPESDSEKEFEEEQIESPDRQGGDLSLSFCEYAADEVDEETSRFSFSALGSKDGSFTASLFGSPSRQPSSSLSGWPLQPIQEGLEGEEVVENEMDAWLNICNTSGEQGTGQTPQEVHAYAVKYRLLKDTFESVQLTLLEYPQFSQWHTKHEPLEKTVPLAEHQEQLQIFNSWVELVQTPRPTTAQPTVRMEEHSCWLVCALGIRYLIVVLVYIDMCAGC